MNNPINYIGSVGESFANEFKGKNIETVERFNVYNAVNSNQFISRNSNFYINNVSNRMDVNKAKNMFNAMVEKVQTGNPFDIYGFDLETVGNFLTPSNTDELNSAMVTEFAMSKQNVRFDSSTGKYITSDVDEVMNYTFGINRTQYNHLVGSGNVGEPSYVQGIIGKIEGGFELTSAEKATAENLLRYSGVSLRNNPDNEYFKKVNGLWSIEKHAPITDILDTQAMRVGADNLLYIGENQFIGTSNGNRMIENIKSTFNNLRSSNTPVVTYNGEVFDMPVLKGMLNNFGIEDVTEGINHFDEYLVNEVSNGYRYLQQAVGSNKAHGTAIPEGRFGTNISQALVRGIDIRGVAHRGQDDIAATLKMMFTGENPLFNDMFEGMTNIKDFEFNTGDTSKVLYSKKALRISGPTDKTNTIATGMLDQFIENNKPRHYMGVSTNLGNYYGIDGYGFIPKENLDTETLKLLGDNSEGLYFMNLRNASNEVDKSALIFRETEEEINNLIQKNFSVHDLVDDNAVNYGLNSVTQSDIDKKTALTLNDNIRRNFNDLETVRKNQALYEYANSKYSVDDIKSNKALSLEDINENLKYNYSEKNLENFIRSYDRIGDEYELNKEIIKSIDENINATTLKLPNAVDNRNVNIVKKYQGSAYESIRRNVDDYLMAIASETTDLSESEIEKAVLGTRNLPNTYDDINKIDILRDTEESLLRGADEGMTLEELNPNKAYTRIAIEGDNIDNLSTTIRNKIYNVGSDMPTGSKARTRVQKEYVNDVVEDLVNRGVLDIEIKNIVNATDDVAAISKTLAYELNNSLEVAKSQLTKTEMMNLNNIGSNLSTVTTPMTKEQIMYANFKKMQTQSIDLNSRTLNGKPFYQGITEAIGNYGEGDGNELLKSIINMFSSNYKDSTPKSFLVKNYSQFTNGNGVHTWLKNLGYSDSNIKNLQGILFGTRGKESANGLLYNNMAAHFYTKNINGVDVPFLSLASNDQHLMKSLLEGNEPKNAVNMMLPYVTNPTMNQALGTVDSASRNKIIQVGGVQKSIISNYNVSYKNGSLRLYENDTIDEIFNVLRYKKNEIVEMMENKNYSAMSRRINRATQKKQLDEVGVSPRVTTYRPDGSLDLRYIPRPSDLDLTSRVVANDLYKYLPYMAEQHKLNKTANEDSAINKLMNRFYQDMGNLYSNEEIADQLSYMRNSIESNRFYSFDNISPDMHEWIRQYTGKDDMYLEAVREYMNIQGDTRGYDIITDLMKGEHNLYTKDSHGKNLIINKSPSIKSNTGAHLTGTSRPVAAQIRSSLPIIYDEFSYDFVQDKIAKSLGFEDELNKIRSNKSVNTLDFVIDKMQDAGINIGPNISTNDVISEGELLKSYGFNDVRGITADLKQVNTEEYLKKFNNIKSNRPYAQSFLDEINKGFNGKALYDINEFDEVFNYVLNNFSTYESGGIVNPRFNFLFDKPQQYLEEVSEEFYNDVLNKFNSGRTAIGLTEGSNLGYLNDSYEPKLFTGQASRIVGVEPLEGTVNPKYRVRYVHQRPNTEGTTKLFAGYTEKGIFSMLDMGDDRKNNLLYSVYDKLFGGKTFAVSSFELFKHQGYGAVAFSYLNTMFEEYSKEGADHLDNYVNKLNNLLPEYNFKVTNNIHTNKPMLSYNANPNPSSSGLTTHQALKQIIGDVESSSTDVDKRISNRFKNMHNEGILRTEFNLAPLEESLGNAVTYEKRHEQMLASYAGVDMYKLFGDDAVRVADEINKVQRTQLVTSKGYNEGIEVLQNMKSTINSLRGNQTGIVDNISLSDINLPSTISSYDEIVDSIIFDFGQVNKNGVPTNSLSINIPGNIAITNPLDKSSKINNIVMPVTRPYVADSKYMLSQMQKKQASVIIALQELEKANKTNDMSLIKKAKDKLQGEYNGLISSFYDEVTSNDGVVSKLMKTTKLDNSGFSLARKVIAPIIDEETGGFLDPAAKNFFRLEDGKVTFLDNVEFSDVDLESKGVSFVDLGKQVNADDDMVAKLGRDIGKDRELIVSSRKNIIEAENLLKTSKEKNEIIDAKKAMKKYEAIIEDTYRKLGKEYMQKEGLFIVGERYPLVKGQSVNVMKAYLNPDIQGRSIVIGPHTAHKMKLDVDGDTLASIFSNMTDPSTGKVKVLSPSDYLYGIYNTIYNAQANGDGVAYGNNALVNTLASDYASDIAKGKYILGDGKSFLDSYETFLENTKVDGLKTILDHDNFFFDELSQDLAHKTISSKVSIGYISNENFILRELSEYMYNNAEGLESKRLIQSFTGDMEQNIFNTKKITPKNFALLDGSLYKSSLKDIMKVEDMETSQRGLQRLIDIVQRAGIYDNDININNILGGTIEQGNTGEQTVSAIYKMLTDDNIRSIRKDPLFWKRFYDEDKSIETVLNIFDGNTVNQDLEGTRLGRDYNLFENLEDYRYLNLNEQVGEMALIRNTEGAEYTVNRLAKTHLGFDYAELLGSEGESKYLVGKTFNDISEQLKNKGFMTYEKAMNVGESVFSSQDSLIRQAAYGEIVKGKGKISKKELNARYDRVKEKMNLSDESMEQIKKSLFFNVSETNLEEYKKAYAKITKGNEDVFDEAYKLMLELNETNALSSEDVMIKTKQFYDDTVSLMQDEMNNSIRDKAKRKEIISSSKRNIYEQTIPSHMYTSLDDYISKYEAKGRSSALNLNPSVFEFVSGENLQGGTYQLDTIDELLTLGDKEFNINGKPSKLNELTIDEIVDFVTKEGTDGTDILRTQEAAKQYLIGKAKLDKYGDNALRSGDRIVERVGEAMNEGVSESAERLSRETKEKVSGNLLKDSFSAIKNHKIAAASIAIGALGLVSVISDTVANKQPLSVDSMPNGDSPSPDGSYETVAPKRKRNVAPPSENKAYLSKQDGLSYNISARNPGRASNKSTVDRLKHFFNSDGNLTVSEQNDTSTVSDSWLQEKISNLL